MNFRTTSIILVSCLLIMLNTEISFANYTHHEQPNSDSSNDYLDFSYISFIIQMIIGGAVAGTIAIIAYYRKFTDFIYKLFKRNKNNTNETRKN